MSVTTAQQTIPQKHQESILVVKRELLVPETGLHGLHAVDFDRCLTIIQQHQEFHPRWQMETDPRYKQIIPYIIFEHNGSFFLMQRKATASEQRLQNKYTLGIGGHIRAEDMGQGKTIFDWARREFHEEVQYAHDLTIEPLGILNDDTNEVGKVHIGFVFLVRGATHAISIKSELKSGTLVPLHDLASFKPHMESWSQYVYDFLLSRRKP